MKLLIRKNLVWVLIFVLSQVCFAQTKTITGTVSDETGPIPGVNIIIKGTSTGTNTNFEGNFEIEASPDDVLIFTYVGYKDIERVVGDNTEFFITLVEDTEALDEVVVTALGVSRDKKSLGYATQEVKGDDVNTVKSGNFANALSGKVSGVQIKTNNNIGGSTNVVIRGVSSLTGNNQALFVVDGVPIDNSNTNGVNQETGRGGYDFGNAASDINPEDIASINVLKGAAASALYGSRAANGVVIITTKKGSKNQGIGVTINSGISTGSIDKTTFPKYQKQYGAGYGPYYDGPGNHWFEVDLTGDGILDQVVPVSEDGSYGAAFDPNLQVYHWNSLDPELPTHLQKSPWVYPENDPLEFFETPVTYTNSFSLDGGSETGSFRLAYTKFNQEGILPNSVLNKDIINFNGSNNFTDKFQASINVSYNRTKGRGRNSTGYSDNIMSMFRQWWQTNVDVKQQKDAYNLTKRNVTWNYAYPTDLKPIYWDNPYWQRYENYETDIRDRIFGNIAMTYEITDWVNVFGRVSVDSYREMQEERIAIGSQRVSEYSRYNRNYSEFNYDLMFNFDYNISEKLHIKGIIGGNLRRQEINSIDASTNGGLIVPGLYTLANSANQILDPIEAKLRKEIGGVYASASLGYDNFIFLDATFRRDQSSTIIYNDGAFNYPSVATSFVFSNLTEASWLSFGKVRLNYAEVGNDAPIYSTYDTYVKSDRFEGETLYSVSGVKKNEDLRPERSLSWEAGLNMDFIGKRVGFDLSLYNTKVKDQILNVALSPTSGFGSKFVNAGEIQNKGIELNLYGSPIKTDHFKWNININWAKNENKVNELFDDVENLQLGDFQGGVTINAMIGQAYGVIQGTDYVYHENGQKIVDEDTGYYLRTTTSDNVIGNVTPDWNAGITNSLSYKDFSLSFLIDIQQGGDVFSLDQYYGRATGLYEETAFINDLGNPVRNPNDDGGGFINPGVNPDGTPNTTRASADSFGSWGYRRLPNKAFVYDASYVKLREISLSYNFKDLIKDKFIKDLVVTLTGSNLWIISKNLPHADPEAGLSSGNLQGFQSGPLPTTRTYGFNVKLRF
ncbi:SusC/RagA family TonB-linked outer membrane protein [Aureivirga sp. CE67]|uniref:SusC/RagA family TonB-linked outer membrane protein n=1 Tax=Aureivirga sp. CE67 TaxID=1788983 RepID=UPI0018CA055F|nr:SusC/RagA family TonB-linked outer membrane protein [Aureivirga sp. CE67]